MFSGWADLAARHVTVQGLLNSPLIRRARQSDPCARFFRRYPAAKGIRCGRRLRCGDPRVSAQGKAGMAADLPRREVPGIRPRDSLQPELLYALRQAVAGRESRQQAAQPSRAGPMVAIGDSAPILDIGLDYPTLASGE